jgi:hypothetical protein
MSRKMFDTKTIYLNEKAENEEKQDVIAELESQHVEVDIEIRASYYYDPGTISGPPENCYPPESEFEVLNTTIIVSKVEFSEKEFALCFPKANEFLDSIIEDNDLQEKFTFEPDFDPPERDDY